MNNHALEEKDPPENELFAQVHEQEKLMKKEYHTTPEQLLLSTPPAETEPSQIIYTIKPTEDIRIHEFADAFPLTEGKEFEQLKRSIEADGQQIPVIMYQGKLLDGRNRLLACRELGRMVNYVEWHGHGTAEEMILAINLRRRHLTTGQKAAIAVKLLPFIEQQAAKRMIAGTAADPREKFPQGKSVDLAGEQVGVSGRSVGKAQEILTASPDIFQQLFIGELTLAQAQIRIKTQAEPLSPCQSSSPSHSTKGSWLKPLKEIIKLVPDTSKEQLYKILEENPILKKALESSAEDDSGDTK
ncbi:MAG: ParB N-terminal domain-containing protein [Lentisphaerota bacterium]